MIRAAPTAVRYKKGSPSGRAGEARVGEECERERQKKGKRPRRGSGGIRLSDKVCETTSMHFPNASIAIGSGTSSLASWSSRGKEVAETKAVSQPSGSVVDWKWQLSSALLPR